MKKIIPLITLISLIFLSGCAVKSSLMDSSLTQQSMPQKNESTITFFRSSLFGGLIQAPIAEATPSGLKLVGICSSGTKIRYIVSPGKHEFVVGGESGALLKADIAPKNNYDVRVSPRFGFVKARFEMIPIAPQDLSTSEIQNEITKCTLVTKNKSTEQWFEKNKSSMESKLHTAREKFQQRKDESTCILPLSYGIVERY